jgi:EAL domain-containing protein (putative c-di-GMP-specific phosphodiesterase class I)
MLDLPAPAQRASILASLRVDEIVTHFQPVLSARQKSLVGVEALARGSRGTADLVQPLPMFELASAVGIRDEVDAICRNRAVINFSSLRGLPQDVVLFLNLQVPIKWTPSDMAAELHDLVKSAHVSPRNVGIEIVEAQIQDMQLVRSLVGILRDFGFLIVLDDVGTGHSNLDRIPSIKPDLLKVDRTLVSQIDSDYHKRWTFKSLVDLGRKIGALVVAEGVETTDEALVTLELGADLLQGFLLAPPHYPASMRDGPLLEALERIESLAKTFRTHMVDRVNARKLLHRRIGIVTNEILSDLAYARRDQFDTVLAQAIGKYPNVECVYILDQAGIQVTDTVWNPRIDRSETPAIFRPTPRGADHSLREYYYVLLDVEFQKYTTDPCVSLASGNLSRTISTYFRDAHEDNMYVLCIDVVCDEDRPLYVAPQTATYRHHSA